MPRNALVVYCRDFLSFSLILQQASVLSFSLSASRLFHYRLKQQQLAMGKEKSSGKGKEDTSKKSGRKKAVASSTTKKAPSKVQKSGSSKAGQQAASKIVSSKVSSQKSSKASSRASTKSNKAKPVASSKVSKSTAAKRAAEASRKATATDKSKSKKKTPQTINSKAGKSVKGKKSKEDTAEGTASEEVPAAQSRKETKKKSSSNRKTKPKPVPSKPEVEEAEEEQAGGAEDGGTGTSSAQVETAASAKLEDAEACNKNSAEYEEVDEGTGEEEPVKEEKLEFTKPTINQMKKDKKEKPLSMAEKISSREFELLFDEISELNSGVQMLKHSYGSIIKSLVAMQDGRRAKKKAAAAQAAAQRPTGDGKVTFLTTLSTCDPADLRTKSCLEAADKYDIERFLNPSTREETFQMLFDEVDELNKRFEKVRVFYDARGRFLRDKYEEQEESKLDRIQFNEYKLWIKKLASIVDDIARNYNDDLLNMFRLN